MPFKKGQVKTPGSGRKPGSINKTTAQMQQYISKFIANYQDSGQMQSDFDLLEPKDKLLIIEKLSNYIMPKRQAVDGAIDINTAPTTLDDTLASLSEDTDN